MITEVIAASGPFPGRPPEARAACAPRGSVRKESRRKGAAPIHRPREATGTGRIGTGRRQRAGQRGVGRAGPSSRDRRLTRRTRTARHARHTHRVTSHRTRRPPPAPGSPLGHTGDRGVHPSADGRSGMKVTRALAPLLPLCERFLPTRPAGLSMTLLKATALELAILAGHLLLYPSGMTQERRVTPTLPHPTRPDCRPRRGPRSSCCTASSTTARSSSCCAAPSRSTAAGTSSRSTTHLSPGTSAPPPSCSAGTSRTSASARARSRWTSSGTASVD